MYVPVLTRTSQDLIGSNRGSFLRIKELPRLLSSTKNVSAITALLVLLAAALLVSRGLASATAPDLKPLNGLDTQQQSTGASPSASTTPSVDGSATPSSASTASNSSSLNINLHSQSYSSTNPDVNSSSASLSVNGQQVPVSNGNINQHFTSDDGHTTVNISVHGSSGM